MQLFVYNKNTYAGSYFERRFSLVKLDIELYYRDR